ncbi:amidohydrolase [Bacillus sp. JJ1503]|uniref:M20 metallopeptidase family protein n=1 Tax=unclassified Bacillus (in: firmicutes) TaxID=185979 RepID=UPI002FFF28FC
MLQKLFVRLEEIYPELVSFRRDMHMYPELSFEEVNTPVKIADFLQSLGLEVERQVGGRGVIGRLKGGKPGKTIAFRADFDALPIQDEKDVEYKSRIPGVMHACGHDIHTASLLGVAKVLSEVKEEISGNVVFIHQFAEEQIPGGAKSMIEDGCLNGVDAIYGVHVWSSLPVGTIGIIDEYAMAAGDKFDIKIIGKGGHGAKPQITIDSLVVGAQLVNNLQNIVSRRIDPHAPAVVTVGTFQAGQAFNVIAERANITGTVRTFDDNVRDSIEEYIKQISHSTCESAGAKAVVEYERGYPPLWNHPDHIQKAENVAIKLVGKENVKYPSPSMGMEDFSYYLKEVPGAFVFVGGGNSDIDADYPQHHPKFNVDERSILISAKLFLSLLIEE